MTTRRDNSSRPAASITTQWCARLPESIPAQTAVISHPHVAATRVFSSAGSHAGTSLPNDPLRASLNERSSHQQGSGRPFPVSRHRHCRHDRETSSHTRCPEKSDQDPTGPRPPLNRKEGDLIIGTGRSAIGTLVERSSRSAILVHLPRIEGWGENPPVKNGPSLGGYGAVAMNAALTASMTQLPGQLRKTLTWDRGKELSGHAQFALDTGTRVFFADPHSPWQRPTNENIVSLVLAC